MLTNTELDRLHARFQEGIPLDRIDQMTESESKAVLRDAVGVIRKQCETYGFEMRENKRILAAIEPTPIDRLREFLKAEGWSQAMGDLSGNQVGIQSGMTFSYYTHKDWK